MRDRFGPIVARAVDHELPLQELFLLFHALNLGDNLGRHSTQLRKLLNCLFAFKVTEDLFYHSLDQQVPLPDELEDLDYLFLRGAHSLDPQEQLDYDRVSLCRRATFLQVCGVVLDDALVVNTEHQSFHLVLEAADYLLENGVEIVREVFVLKNFDVVSDFSISQNTRVRFRLSTVNFR